jgi:hypothetical protein
VSSPQGSCGDRAFDHDLRAPDRFPVITRTVVPCAPGSRRPRCGVLSPPSPAQFLPRRNRAARRGSVLEIFEAKIAAAGARSASACSAPMGARFHSRLVRTA